MTSCMKSAHALSALLLAMIPQLGTAQDLNPTKADQAWLLPAAPPSPADNKPSAARVALGKMLFFDPRLSRDGNMACATCHNPLLGWSDGLGTARGFKSQ